MKTWILILVIPFIRLLINLNSWAYLRKVIIEHEKYVIGIANGASKENSEIAEKSAAWLTANLTEIKRKVESADVVNPQRTTMEPAGYGHVAPITFSTLDNMLLQNTEILKEARHLLHMTKGHYLTQVKQSINPIYWLELIFFLPKSIVSAAGIEHSSKVAEMALKITQVIYWLVIIWAFIFKPEIFDFIIDNAKT